MHATYLLRLLVLLPLVCAFPGMSPRGSRQTTITYDPVAYPYVAPGPGDQRGPCTGLNTLANHGYIPHNGIATLDQMVDAMIGVYSFDPIFATMVATIELAWIGDVGTEIMSLGTPVSGEIPGLIPIPWSTQGLDYHGAIEADASLTRGDNYYHDDHSFNSTRWGQLVNIAEDHSAPWQTDYWADVRYFEWEQSYLTNPDFTFGPLQYIFLGLASYFAQTVFRPQNQNGTYASMASFFVNETIPAGFGIQTQPVSLLVGLSEVFYFYWKHPVPLVAPDGDTVDFPTDVTCMVCFLSATLIENLPTLPLLGFDLLSDLLLEADLQCLYPTCG